jgi:hypothetical protein
MLWSTEGTLLRELQRYDPKFPSYRTMSVTQSSPPKPLYRAVQERADGRLLTLILVADERWRSGVTFYEGPHGSAYRTSDLQKLYDTIVEVIDPASGQLLATARFDGVLTQFVGPDLVAQLTGDGMTTAGVSIQRLVLVSPPK